MNKKIIGVVIASISCVAMISNLGMISRAHNVKLVEGNNASSTELLEDILAHEELDDIVFYNDQDNILKIKCMIVPLINQPCASDKRNATAILKIIPEQKPTGIYNSHLITLNKLSIGFCGLFCLFSS